MKPLSEKSRTELRALVRLSAPVAVSQLALIGMGVTDVLIAGRAGTDQLAGMMLGNNLWTLVAYFFFGIGLATQPLIGQAFGADDLPRIRWVFQNACYASLVVGLLCMVCAYLVSLALPRMGYDPVLAHVGSAYLGVMALGGLAMAFLPVVRSTLEAMNQTAPVTRVLILGFLLNIPLDLALVFGFGPLPELGSVGCAVASVIILWLMLCLLSSLANSAQNAHLGLFTQFARPDRRLILEYLRLGLPIGITISIELGFFVAAALLVAYFGPAAASAHSVAISTASVAFMLYMGLGQGMAIRASQFIGAGKPAAAAYSIKVGVSAAVLVALCCSLSLLIFRHQLPWIYTADPAVIGLASLLLAWAALFQLVDGIQCVGM